MKTRVQTEFAKKWTGCVEVKSNDTSVRFTSIQETKAGIKAFPDGEKSFKIKLADLPKLARKVIKPNMTGKKFRIRLNEDGDAVETVTPYDGVYKGRATGLGPKTEDGDFRLIHKVYNEGTEKENRHDEFISIYEITEGAYQGVELPAYYLHYKFEEIPEGEEDEGFTQFNTVDNPQASQLHKLQKWAEVHGDVLEEPIKWVDAEDGTILEEIEERVLENDRPVILIFDKGYINGVQPVDEVDEEPDEELPDFLKDDEEDKPVKKAPAKKKVKATEPDDDL